MSYKTNKKTKAKIDALLEKNASYQAANTCVSNSKSQRKKMNTHCQTNFIKPIKDLDPEFYTRIQLA